LKEYTNDAQSRERQTVKPVLNGTLTQQETAFSGKPLQS